MLGLTATIYLVLAFLAFSNWRSAPVLCVIAALLQDPLRKLAPEQPVYFVLLVGLVFGAACVGAWMQNVSFSPDRLFLGERKLKAMMYALLMLIILEAANSFLRFNNVMITATGLLVYLLPIPSIILAYQLVVHTGERGIRQFILAYVVLIALALSTVYLEYKGYESSLFGQVGTTLLIYDKYIGGVIVPHSGLFRASEIAAWHAMACACFAMILPAMRRFSLVTVLGTIALVLALVGIATLTGRRKAVFEVAVFAGTYLTLWCVLQKKAQKIGLFLAVLAVAGFGWWVSILGEDVLLSPDEGRASYYSYVERSKTVFSDAPARFVELGIAPVMWAYEGFGLFGAGVGTGTQGAQHFGRNEDVAGAAEGGLGKLTLELGIPGLALSLVFALFAASYLWRILRYASQVSPRVAAVSYGLFSFLVANAAGFSVATQAYSDIFVLLTISWTLGFLLAIPALLKRVVPGRDPQLTGAPVGALRPRRI